MKYAIFLALALLSLGLQAQQTEGSYQQFFHKNGKLSSEGTLRQGKPDGYWKTYYENGQLKSAGLRTNFELDSLWLFFAETGDTLELIEYRAGQKNGYSFKYQLANDTLRNIPVQKELWLKNQRHGLAQYYHPSGQLKEQVHYDEGRRQGEGRVFDPAGNVVAVNMYKNDFLVFQERINRRDLGGLRQGPWREYFDNGKVKTESNYKDDKLHGLLKRYDERGRVLEQTRFDLGEPIVERKVDSIAVKRREEFHANGKLLRAGGYIGDKPVGIHREYDPEGKITAAKTFSLEGILEAEGLVQDDGTRIGKWTNLYATGQAKSEGSYRNNRREGPWRFFLPNGKLEQQGEYSKGKNSGTWRWYYPTGELWREEEYADGLREGPYVEYNREGKVIAKGNFLADERDGAWLVEVGDQREEGNYRDGMRVGTWRYFYPDGTLSFEGDFADGEPNARHRYFFPNGKLKEQRSYLVGKEHGTWKKFDETGALLLEIEYRSGVERRIDGVEIPNQ